MAFALEQAGCATRLRPFTTRKRRVGEHDEYLFLSEMEANASTTLWSYAKSGALYGLTTDEMARIPAGEIGVVPIHTEGIEALGRVKIAARIILLGLDTIDNAQEQLERVGRIPTRAQTPMEILETRCLVRALPICFDGDHAAVTAKLVVLAQTIRAGLSVA